MKSPMVTIIIPVYNVEKYVGICVDSAITQTYSNVEIIIIDDGSTDQSGKICDEYKLKDKRISVIHKKNNGVASARNYGLDIMKGEYVVFLDSDDYLHIRAIEIWMKLITVYQADIAVAKFRNVYDKDNPDVEMTKKLKKIKRTVKDPSTVLSYLFDHRYVETVLICNKLFSRKLFDDLYFSTEYFHIDEHIAHILINKSNKIAFCNVELYFYLQRSTSFMNAKMNTRRLDVLHASLERANYFKDRDMEVLYNQSLFVYFTQVIYFYQCFEEQGNTEVKNNLYAKYKSDYKNSLVGSNVLMKYKILFALFYLHPVLYKKLFSLYPFIKKFKDLL